MRAHIKAWNLLPLILVFAVIIMVTAASGCDESGQTARPGESGADGDDSNNPCNDPTKWQCDFDADCIEEGDVCNDSCQCVAGTDEDPDGDEIEEDKDGNTEIVCSTEPCIGVSPRLLDYGPAYLYVPVQKSFKMRNDGVGTLEILDVRVTDDPAGNYEIVPPFGDAVYLEPDATHTIYVELETTQPGIHESKVEIVSNAENERLSIVKLQDQYKGHTAMCVDPETSYDFGTVEVGGVAIPLPISIESLKCDDVMNKVLFIRKIELDPPLTQHFTLQEGLQNIDPLNPEDIWVFTIIYKPRGLGLHDVTVKISNDADYKCSEQCVEELCEPICDHGQSGADPYTISLTGRGVIPKLSITPDPIIFGDVTVGQTASIDVVFKADAESGGIVQLEGINWQGLDSTVSADPPFEFIDPADAAFSRLPPGQFVTVRVTCSPTQTGPFNNFLEVHSNDLVAPTRSVGAQCNGVQGSVYHSPQPVDFGEVLLEATAGITVTVYNTGQGDLVIIDELMDCGEEPQPYPFELGDLSQLQLPVQILGGGQHEFVYKYTPKLAGRDLLQTSGQIDACASILVLQNASSPDHRIPLSGTPVWPLCQFSSPNDENFVDTLDFGEVNISQSKSMIVNITNHGEWPCQFNPNPSLEVGSSSDFSFLPPIIPDLPPFDRRPVTVTYNPEFYPGPDEGVLKINTNDFRPANAEFEVILTGIGVSPKIFVTPQTHESNPYRMVDENGDDVYIEDCSVPVTVEITNIGVGMLEIGDIDWDVIGIQGSWILDDCDVGGTASISEDCPSGATSCFLIPPVNDDINAKVTCDVTFCPQGYALTQYARLHIISYDVNDRNHKVHFVGTGRDCDPGWFTILNDYNGDGEPDYPRCTYPCIENPDRPNVQYEICDGFDNDCDALFDEDFPIYLQPWNKSGGKYECTGVGECGAGVYQCIDDEDFLYMCSTMPGGDDDMHLIDLCDGKDNDCDSEVDEDFHIGELCAGIGECRLGEWECAPGDPYGRICNADDEAEEELCDGKDNDCDGFVDEAVFFKYNSEGGGDVETCGGQLPWNCPECTYDPDDPEIPCVGTTCEGTGNCGDQGGTDGHYICMDPFMSPDGTRYWVICSADTAGDIHKILPEVYCNNKDDDCDGQTDEGFFDIDVNGQPIQTSCNGQHGICVNYQGYLQCNPNNETQTICSTDEGGDEYAGFPEKCNGMDDNCDGFVDEDFGLDPSQPVQVCQGIGECPEGVFVCDPDDNTRRMCSTDPGGPDYGKDEDGNPRDMTEYCDGKDNDCDTITDNNYHIGDTCIGIGECGVGKIICNGLYDTMCDSMENPPLNESRCDFRDEDCDSLTDEDFRVNEQCQGTGECGEVCDENGENCFPVYGTYECEGLFDFVCSTDWGGSEYRGRNELCDGIDNNCDGETDEDLLIGQACHGIGACGWGVWECRDNPLPGEPINVCSTMPGGSEYPDPPPVELCNYIDDNCNGEIDEGFDVCHSGDINNCGFCQNVCYVEHGTPKCEDCVCKIDQCATGWYDVDGRYDTGCECQLDSYDQDNRGDTCDTAVTTSPDVLIDNSGQRAVVSGNIAPIGDVDWYKVTGQDDPEAGAGPTYSDEYHVSIKFLSNEGGEFAFDVYADNCTLHQNTRLAINTTYFEHRMDSQWPGDVSGCSSLPDPAAAFDEWAGARGHSPCRLPTESSPNQNDCEKQDFVYFIKVYRWSSSPTCATYELEISNGLESTSRR